MCIVRIATAAAALVLACAATAAAAPAHGVLSVDLAEVMDKSVCPIRVRIDEDEQRIPRRIKVLECARAPSALCHRERLAHACCRAHHHQYSTQCVNVTDHVLVRYRNLGDDAALHKLPVAVGCACMIRESTHAVVAQ